MLWIIAGGMALVAIFHLLFIGSFLMDYFVFREFYRVYEFPLSNLVWMIILAVGAVIIVYVIYYLLDKDTYYEKEVETKSLISVKSDQAISGHGSGSFLYYAFSIENQNTYSYYYEVDGGGIQKESIDAKYTVIYEKEKKECVPRVEKHKNMKRFHHPAFVGAFTFRFYDSSSYTYHYEMYVPKGTILRKFELD